MRCYECKHWSQVSTNGLLITGTCSQAPVIRLPQGKKKVLKSFHAEAECRYLDFFEQLDDVSLKQRQKLIDSQKSPCWHLLSENFKIPSYKHKAV